VCSIGTTDPWNAAGLGLDIRVLAECGARPLTIVAGVSAQDAGGLRALFPLPAEAIAAQFAALAEASIAAYRIGALLDAASVVAVVAGLGASRAAVVYDPVLAASAGGRFADESTLAAIRTLLLPRADVVTPNASEAALLAEATFAGDAEGMAAAAVALRARGARAVLVTGGDLSGAPVDVLLDDAGSERFSGERIAGTMRGTGCVLSAALAASLAHGHDLRTAVRDARAFVRKKLLAPASFGPFRLAY